MNLIIFIKHFFKSEWTIKPPKKNKYVLVDGDYNPFLKYISAKVLASFNGSGEKKS